ncbi:MAG: arylamine N-acetyltransferase [Nitrospinales bacterium]
MRFSATGDSALDIDAYLERIKYKGSRGNSVQTLIDLHIAHAFNIPFENLDIHLGRKISLDPTALFDKLIPGGRGGYCHEINSLFYFLLTQLGFEAKLLMARVMCGSDSTGPKLHQLLLVQTNAGDWIADPGFGGNGLIAPIPLREGVEEKQFADIFRLEARATRGYVLQSQIQDSWVDLYSFERVFYLPIDYILPNYYNSTSPDSIFTRKKICTKPTPEGRITLIDRELRIRRNGASVKRQITNPEEYLETLRKYFDIQLSADAWFKKWF